MAQQRHRRPRVVICTFAGAQGLDVFGPVEVFAGVARASGKPGYEVVIAASDPRTVVTSSGIRIGARALASVRPARGDTVLYICGGDEPGIRGAVGDPALVRFVARAARTVRRIGSVCSGAFVLARAGILDGRRAATHWEACARLAAYRPAVAVDREAIYVRDGNVWTSAGVTTGIDMALAMVEDDLGREVADAVAARLVLHARRPGFQSQWSAALVAERERGAPFARAIAWLRAHVREPVDVPRLARHCAMSVRTFHRRCLAELQLTPRALIEKVRVEEARTLLGSTALPVKAIAARTGFTDAAHLAHAFQRTLGMAPSAYRVVSAR